MKLRGLNSVIIFECSLYLRMESYRNDLKVQSYYWVTGEKKTEGVVSIFASRLHRNIHIILNKLMCLF